MRDITDYVRFISKSMGIVLNEDKINRIAKRLVRSDKYGEMLHELEEMILEENEKRLRRIK